MHEIDIIIWKFGKKIVCALHACDNGIDSIYVDLDLNIRHDLQVRQPPRETEEVHKQKMVKNNEATQGTSTEGQQRMMVLLV
jgi:hypothetical protein